MDARKDGRPSGGEGPGLERLAFARGLKPALRLRLGEGRGEEASAYWRGRGAYAVAFEGILYVARDPALARELADVEEPIRPDRSPGRLEEDHVERHRTLGRLLGYPACCVDGFLERLRRGVTTTREGRPSTERAVAARDALARSERCYGRLNVLLPRREALVPFDPCRFDCEPALRYATALLEAYGAHDAVAAERLRERLVVDIVVDDETTIRFSPL